MIRPPTTKALSFSLKPFLSGCIAGLFLFSLAAVCRSNNPGAQTAGESRSRPPELVLQTGHSSGVSAVALSRDNRVLASASADNTVRLWDVSSGLELRVLTGHAGWVKCVSFSPDGKLLASGSNDRTIKLWDVETGAEVRQLTGHSGTVETVSFSDDGHFLVSGSADTTAKLWDTESWRDLRTLNGHSDWVTVVSFSPDGRWLVTVSKDKTIQLWDLTYDKQPPRLIKNQADRVNAVSFTPNSQFFATAHSDHTVTIWKTSNGKEVKTLRGLGSVLNIAFSNDGRELISINANKAVTVWNVDSGRPGRLAGDAKALDSFESIAIANDRQLFASSAGRAIELYSTATGDKIRTFDSRAAGLYTVALSEDGRWLASGSKDSTVRLWDLLTGRQLPALLGHSGYITSLSFSKDSHSLVSASVDRTLRIWDTATGEEKRKLIGHEDTVGAVTFSPDGKWIASSSLDRTVRVWSADEGREVRKLMGHLGEVTSVAFSGDGRWLASGSVDKTVRIWDTTNWGEPRVVDVKLRVGAIAFNSQSTLLAVGSELLIKLIDVSSAREVRASKTQAGDVRALAFNRDGSKLLSASTDQAVRIWNVSTMSEPQTLLGHAGSVYAVAFTNDAKWVASASDDATVVLWDSDTRRKAATLISFREGSNWLVVTADGLFDGSPASWNQILWRFASSTFNVAPAEAFFNEFYYPGVLADILAGKHPRAPSDIALKDRRQPQINLSLLTPVSAAITSRTVTIKVDLSESKSDGSQPTGSGVRDVRLFRNGSLVKVWHGDVALDDAGKAKLETTVSLVAGRNDLTAYAFNRDNIKSTDVRLSVTGDDQLKRKGTLFILNVGINQYANSEYNLRYAVPDAEDFGEELKRSQLRLGAFDEVQVIRLLDHEATKSNIMQALKRLMVLNIDSSSGSNAPEFLKGIGPARPEDAVIIYFAGHGIAPKDGRFYLVPHDLGYTGLRTALDIAGRQQIIANSISDTELEKALENIDAGQFLLVIDACNSGQALEAEEKRRGPMNAKGLAQLAYEKGMHILTAAQSYQAALEQRRLGHGYLTYALVEEGLRTRAADLKPKDGDITLPEWLDYAVSRVPLMQVGAAKNEQGRLLEHEEEARKNKERDVQRPRVFYRFGFENKPLIIARLQPA